MPSFAAEPDPESYLEHLEWVRGLALRLVGDPAEADDLRQEVWLLAQRLQSPPSGALRAWLGGLLRNVVRERRRARSTRALHEEKAALERAVSSQESPVVREVSIQQVVVEHVVRLNEPYRSTILARYYEGLSPDEIATRDGLPVATVKTRLRRGLATLRGELRDREERGTNALAALAVVVWRPDVRSAATAASTASSFVLPLTLLAALVAVFAVLVSRSPSAPEPSGGETVAAPPGPPGPTVEIADLEPDAVERSSVAPSEDEGEADPTDVTSTAEVEVVDLSGTPVEDVEVRFVETLASGDRRMGPWSRTDARGVAQLDGVEGGGAVQCRRSGFLQFGFPVLDAESSERSFLAVVAPAIALRGRVVDAAGDGVSRAALEFGLRGSYAARIGRSLDSVALERFTTNADASGAFEMSVPDDGFGLDVRVSRVGFHVLRQELVEFDAERGVDFVLQPIRDPAVLFGAVVDGRGEPVARAWVSNGTTVVRADGAGEFQLGGSEGSDRIHAGAPGQRPITVELAGLASPLRLELDGDDLTIAGRVVDGAGDGVADVWVYPRDLEPVGRFTLVYLGRTATAELALESFGQLESNGPVPAAPVARTSADGTFELVGLRARDYDLEVFDERTLARTPVQTVPAGATSVELVAVDAPRPFRGRVVTTEGEPVAGIAVRSFATLADDDDATEHPGPVATTDADGRFEFASLARGSVVRVAATRDRVHLGERVVDPAQGGEVEITLVPGARVQLSIRADVGAIEDGRTPTTFSFRDAAGAVVPHVVDDIYEQVRPVGTFAGPPHEGRFRPLPVRVPTRAIELVIGDDDGPLLVLPIDLEPGREVVLED